MWALGCLIYELAALEPPFISQTQAGLSEKIKCAKLSPLPKQYSPELGQFIRYMLTPEVEMRPQVKRLLKNPTVLQILKEREIKERISDLDRRLVKVEERERIVEQREAMVEKRLALLSKREQSVADREAALGERGTGGD